MRELVDKTCQYLKYLGVSPICLPEASLEPEDSLGLVTSWERLSSRSGLRSEVLGEVSVRTVSQERCERKYGGRYRISQSVICAQTDGEDFCQPDSWSSLTTVDHQGRHFIIGVTSWGQRCSKPGYPGLYTFTTIAAIRDWLQSTLAPPGDTNQDHYPERLFVSSRGGGSKDRPEVLGLYKITETFHSDRPVWQNTAPPHRYLLYNGKLISFIVSNIKGKL